MPKLSQKRLRILDERKKRIHRKERTMNISDDYFKKCILPMSRIPKTFPIFENEPTPLARAIETIASQHDLIEVQKVYLDAKRKRRKEGK